MTMVHQPEYIEPPVIEAAVYRQDAVDNGEENSDPVRLVAAEGSETDRIRHQQQLRSVDEVDTVPSKSTMSTAKDVDGPGADVLGYSTSAHSLAPSHDATNPKSSTSATAEQSSHNSIPFTSPSLYTQSQQDAHIGTQSVKTDALPTPIRPEAAQRVNTTRSLATSFATTAISEDQLKEELEGRPDKPQALWRCLINRNLPAPVPKYTMENAPLMPRYNASWLSKLTFTWIQPLITLGYQRFLVKEDLWKLGDEDESAPLADKVIVNWEKRLKAVEDWNTGIDNGSITVKGWKRIMWKLRRKRKDFKKDVPGLEWAVSDTFFVSFWSAGLIKIAADTLNITSPLVTRKIITFGTQRYLAARNVPGYTSPPIGEGFGWAVLLLFMQLFSSFCMHAFFAQTMTVGVLARGALIAGLYRRAVGLSGKARATITTGKLVNHISTDISRIDFAAGFFHMSWTAPIQLLVVIGILCQQMGAVALTGVAFVLIATPLQGIAMKKMFSLRQKAMVWTDKRAKLIQELLGGMRILKFFAWEDPYLAKLAGLRKQELTKIRTLLLLRAATMAVAMSLPALATVIAFTAYAYTNPGDSRNPATIFTSLTLFNLLRMPLMLLPVALATATDAKNAFNRLREVFLAEQLTRTYTIDRDSKYALTVESATFLWETSPPKEEDKKSKGAKAAAKATAKKEKKAEKAERLAQKAHSTAVAAAAKTSVKQKQSPSRMPWKTTKNINIAATDQAANDAHDSEAVTREVTDSHIPVPPPTSSSFSSDTREGSIDETTKGKEQIGATGADGTPDEIREKSGLVSEATDNMARNPQVKDVNIRIPHGQLCAIVGPVGSGKSSLLAGLIGEMKVLSGDVKFGGSVGYCAQQAWIQNATVRDNILFGQAWDAKRYADAIYNACLTADLEMLPHGDQTEIGEKGINLSGGQKQRVNIARALYFNADITLFDDPLSAVDAHVGHHLFEHALRGALAGKTRILVTHALHFLPRVDNIITIENGRVVEQGTYDELIARNGAFAALVAEFGNQEEEEAEEADNKTKSAKDSKKSDQKERKKEKATKLMQEEERATGAVGAAVYGKYLRAAGFSMFPLVLTSLILMQTATVINSYFLVWWQQNTFNQETGFYLGLYAATAIASAFFTFVMGAAAAFMGFNVSSALHKAAIVRVLHAPMSLFDTTPLGRIMNRFAKDMDTIDNTLNDSMRMALSTFSQIMGSIVLIAIVNQYFLVAVVVILILYGDFARVYRYSAREVKRLDNLLRSSLYAHFSESLSGLATIRAYGETQHFLKTNAFYTDVENRAYYLTVINQRWLGIRLDWLGIALVFVVSVIAVTEAENISPSQIGLILSFILGIQMAFTFAVRQLAEVENDMNSVERLLHYGDNLEQEAPFQIPERKPAPSWPAKGQITFDNVQLRYRPGLPLVLHGLSLEVKGGDKIGVIGRTGAGKSSLMQAIFRIVELDAGSISIDGQDIAKIGLFDLRSRVAIIPQDALLFAGTLRSNLDPFGDHDDARLWNALRRAYLVDRKKGGKGAAEHSRFNLDMTIDEEGQNLSVGERSLVSLARALVKDSRVVILDEATASVDLATDALIQRTIRTEFGDKTLLTIAHRLKTIISYDRVLVMDKGMIAEFATPIELFDEPDGIFRGMCEQSNIAREDIIKAKTESILSDHDADVLREAIVEDTDTVPVKTEA